VTHATPGGRWRQPHAARLWAAALGLAMLAGLTAGCSRGKDKETPGAGGGKGRTPTAGVLAQVNDATLTEADLQRLIPPELREGITGGEVRDVLDRWVSTELLYQKARQDGLDRDAQVAARLHDMERDLLADEVLQRELAARVQVSGEELQAYYRQHLAMYTQEVQLKQILVGTRDEADDVLQLLRNGAQFEALARQRSTDASAAKGGDLGFLGKGAMNPAFEPVVFAMQPGELGGPIATTEGFHVVKVAAKRPADDPISFEAARDEIMHALLLERQQAAQGELLKELRGAASVSVASSYAGMSLAPDAAPVSQSYRANLSRPSAGADTTAGGND
jgi:peptidyl-prolyl cis-trans isomerase C